MSLVARVTALAQTIAADIKSLTSGKVDKVNGKALSANDYTTTEKNKLSGIAEGAQVNSVTSVAGRTGAVTLEKADVGLGSADNTADSAKPVSTPQRAALDAKVSTTTMTAAGFLTQQLSQPTGSDFDNAGATQFELKTGISSTTNKPPTAGNGWVNVLGMPRDASNSSQLATGVTAEGVWYRRKENSVYKDWRQLAFTDNASFTGPFQVNSTGASPIVITSGLGALLRHNKGAAGGQLDIDDVPFSSTDQSLFRFNRNVTTSGNVQVSYHRGDGSTSVDHSFKCAGTNNANTSEAILSAGGGRVAIGTTAVDASATLLVGGATIVNGPVKVGQYTLTTLPSASAFSGYEIDVTNATGGPRRCRSNGSAWQILNTTTTVS